MPKIKRPALCITKKAYKNIHKKNQHQKKRQGKNKKKLQKEKDVLLKCNQDIVKQNCDLQAEITRLREENEFLREHNFQLSSIVNTAATAAKDLLSTINNMFTMNLAQLVESFPYIKSCVQVYLTKFPISRHVTSVNSPIQKTTRGINKVNPMIQGRVIHKPVISLRRYNAKSLNGNCQILQNIVEEGGPRMMHKSRLGKRGLTNLINFPSSSAKNTVSQNDLGSEVVNTSNNSNNNNNNNNNNNINNITGRNSSNHSSGMILLNNNSITQRHITDTAPEVVERLRIPPSSEVSYTTPRHNTDDESACNISSSPSITLKSTCTGQYKKHQSNNHYKKRKLNMICDVESVTKIRRNPGDEDPLEGTSWMHLDRVTNNVSNTSNYENDTFNQNNTNIDTGNICASKSITNCSSSNTAETGSTTFSRLSSDESKIRPCFVPLNSVKNSRQFVHGDDDSNRRNLPRKAKSAFLASFNRSRRNKEISKKKTTSLSTNNTLEGGNENSPTVTVCDIASDLKNRYLVCSIEKTIISGNSETLKTNISNSEIQQKNNVNDSDAQQRTNVSSSETQQRINCNVSSDFHNGIPVNSSNSEVVTRSMRTRGVKKNYKEPNLVGKQRR